MLAPAAPPAPLADAFAAELGSPVEGAAADFLRQAADDARDDELPGVTPADLAAVLAGFWRFAAASASDDAVLDIAPARGDGGRPLGLDLLYAVQPDAPFLVDSLMGELADAGLDVRAMFHPVVDLRGSSTSLILVVLGEVGADRRDDVLARARATFQDVRCAVEDFEPMRALMSRVQVEMEGSAAARTRSGGDMDEYGAFLRWLTGDRFTFLGAREYLYPRDASGAYAAEEPEVVAGSSLGVLRDLARPVLRRASEPAMRTDQLARYLDADAPLVVAKSNLRSRVHRHVYMDYVGVKRYGSDGKAVGETRFVGLFTAEAYEEAAREIPLIRRKLAEVMDRAGANPSAHTGKRLRHIVESYPRDELFQMSADELFETAMGVLHLYNRPRVRLFARKDPFDRFISVLLFTPRDRYSSEVRARVGALLARAWDGRVSAFYPQFGEEPLARVHFIIGVTPGAHPEPDLRALEAEVEELVRTWRDRFDAAVRAAGGEVAQTLARWGDAFPAGYRDRYAAPEALADLAVLGGAGFADGLQVRAYRDGACSPLQFRFKLYRQGPHPAPLADIVPVLENMGLKAIEEEAHALRPADADPVWVQDFLLEDEHGDRLTFADIQAPFEDAFEAVWRGRAENDGFNRLVLELGVGWREAALVRALARYRQQSGLDPSISVVTQALADHREVARLILELFRTKFDPAVEAPPAARLEQAEAVFARITAALQEVASLDADRALRRIALLVRALKRTNYHQPGPDGRPKPHISFKVASRELEDLPLPKPHREIFVSAPHVEGVHLRFGPVARGGLRWSDRRDDFRTEVLGLVKAQQVKNAVIVPVGSKGGFFPKLPIRNLPPEQVRAQGVDAYKTFLSGLLDVTDNLDASGAVEHPADVVISGEGDDPYLVVAADKGTATFSDIANGVAQDYGFWLDDAFASGGSAGYDHKAMGITARGAWEAVRRHFREMGKDIQSDPFTMAGVGDMSGDVFGNGALLSKQIKLVAAFDHRHVFLDPTPDTATSWAERDRMFALPRSSWEEYDKALISPGGGVFARSLKSIPLSPQVQAMLGVAEPELAPADLIRAILKMEVELLYLGGIGTYVKAPVETHADVGDKANDAVRIDAGELRAKVVGEGANLGFTQAGRIAFARGGGRINTDAIDNSAGVDTSDHEVNIKILLGQVIRSGELKQDDRNPLLASMTDDVAEHVLAHNKAQTLTLSLQQMDAVEELDAHARFMADLVGAGRLDRKVEGLPGPAAIADLRAAGRGLTRPELAVLTAYGKLELSAELIDGAAPDDPWFERTLLGYFPRALERFEGQMKRHRLRRDIIGTVLANRAVDWMGPTFASRVQASTGANAGEVVVAFEAARAVFDLDAVWAQIGALGFETPAEAQLSLYREVSRAARAHTFWLARRRTGGAGLGGVQALVDAYRPAAAGLSGSDLLSPFEAETVERRAASLTAVGAPHALSQRVAALRGATATVEVADLARTSGQPPQAAARAFAAAGERFGFDRLRAAASSLPAADPYERTALRGLVAEFTAEQVELARSVMTGAGPAADRAGALAALDDWSRPRREAVDRARRTVDEIAQAGGDWTFAKLTLANAALRQAAG